MLENIWWKKCSSTSSVNINECNSLEMQSSIRIMSFINVYTTWPGNLTIYTKDAQLTIHTKLMDKDILKLYDL